MKPFDLEAALRGEKVVTRDGRDVTEIHYFKTAKEGFPVVAIIEGKKICFNADGSSSMPEIRNDNDLFMAITKNKGWIAAFRPTGERMYRSPIYRTREEAENDCRSCYDKVSIIEIEWEE